MTGETQPWDKLPGESTRAFAAFCAYRNLGTSRSLRAAYATTEKGQEAAKRGSGSYPSSWDGWSSTFRWPERVRAYDAYLERRDRDRREAERDRRVDEARARAERIGQRLQTQSEALLTALEGRLQLPIRIDARHIPAILRAAGDGATRGLNLELDALGLRDYLDGKEMREIGRDANDEAALSDWEEQIAAEEGSDGQWA